MRIATIGAGMIGSTLGRLWADAGHEVRLSSRHPETIEVPGLPASSVDDAVAWAEVVLLAIPLGAVPRLSESVKAALRDKVVVDANNAIPKREGAVVEAIAASGEGSGRWTAAQLPGAHVVKAFNTVYFKNMVAAKGGERAIGVPVAADDASAAEVVEVLVRDAGMTPVRVGDLASSARFDFGSPVWNSGGSAEEVRRDLGLP